jgi:hypothetical protein
MIDLLIPMGMDIFIQIVDEGFGVGDFHQQCRCRGLELIFTRSGFPVLLIPKLIVVSMRGIPTEEAWPHYSRKSFSIN